MVLFIQRVVCKMCICVTQIFFLWKAVLFTAEAYKTFLAVDAQLRGRHVHRLRQGRATQPELSLEDGAAAGESRWRQELRRRLLPALNAAIPRLHARRSGGGVHDRVVFAARHGRRDTTDGESQSPMGCVESWGKGQ